MYRDQQQSKNFGFRARDPLRLPAVVGKNGKRYESHEDEESMNDELTTGCRKPNEEMSVRVAEKKTRLIEGQTECPDCRRAAEPWQNSFTDHRLNKKDQKCRGENGGDEDSPAHQLTALALLPLASHRVNIESSRPIFPTPDGIPLEALKFWGNRRIKKSG